MKPKLHPDHPKAIYREIANDAFPITYAETPEAAASQETPWTEDELILAALGLCVLFLGFIAIVAARGAL